MYSEILAVFVSNMNVQNFLIIWTRVVARCVRQLAEFSYLRLAGAFVARIVPFVGPKYLVQLQKKNDLVGMLRHTLMVTPSPVCNYSSRNYCGIMFCNTVVKRLPLSCF